MTLLDHRGHEITSSKTSVRRAQPNPLYKETFVFQITQSQLTDVSLSVSVFVRRSFKMKEMFGWFTMGRRSASGPIQSYATHNHYYNSEELLKNWFHLERNCSGVATGVRGGQPPLDAEVGAPN